MVTINDENWKGKKVIVARDENKRIISWSKRTDKKPISYYRNQLKKSNSFNPIIINSFTLGRSQKFKGKKVKSVSSKKRIYSKNKTQMRIAYKVIKDGKIVRGKDGSIVKLVGYSYKGSSESKAKEETLRHAKGKAVQEGILKGTNDKINFVQVGSPSYVAYVYT